MTFSTSPAAASPPSALAALLIAAFAAALAGCNTTTASDTTGSIPDDYRERHPIAVKEGKKSLVLFVGAGRGGLSPMQRAEVLAFAQNWKRDATGGITIDRAGRRRQRARRQRHAEGSAVDPRAGRRAQQRRSASGPTSAGANDSATLRLNYPLMAAEAGPCGLWPDDLGPSYDTKHYREQAVLQLRLRDAAQPRGHGRRTRPTSCSRAPKAPPTTPSAPSASTNGARAKARRRSIPMPERARSAIWANDQNRTANRHA